MFQILIFFLTLLPRVAFGDAVTTPTGLVNKFYLNYGKLESTRTGIDAMSEYLSKELVSLLQQARIVDEKHVRDYPTEKPPMFGDGFCYFINVGDCGFSTYKIAKSYSFGDTEVVTVDFTLEVQNKPKILPHKWSLDVLLGRENSRWVILDVEGTLDYLRHELKRIKNQSNER